MWCTVHATEFLGRRTCAPRFGRPLGTAGVRCNHVDVVAEKPKCRSVLSHTIATATLAIERGRWFSLILNRTNIKRA